MSSLPSNCRFVDTHEWCRLEDHIVTMGITKHAADALTDLVCIEYQKEVGDEIEKDEEFGVVDSVKASEPLITPIAGKVVGINTLFEDDNKLALVSDSPYDEGWLIKIEIKDVSVLDSLMSAEQYQKYLDEEA
jgi:glycine cleavage system H protein